jgi:hypothetical protein
MSKLLRIINDIDNSIGLYANNYSIKQEDKIINARGAHNGSTITLTNNGIHEKYTTRA